MMKAAPTGNGTPSVTPRQQVTIDALATGTPITSVAKQVGVTRRTVYNWLETEPFRGALETRRRELADTVRDRVGELGHAAINALVKYLTPDREPGDYGVSHTRAVVSKDLLEKMGLLNMNASGVRRSVGS